MEWLSLAAEKAILHKLEMPLGRLNRGEAGVSFKSGVHRLPRVLGNYHERYWIAGLGLSEEAARYVFIIIPDDTVAH